MLVQNCTLTELHVPFCVGIAFVPDGAGAPFALPETERPQLAERRREAFKTRPPTVGLPVPDGRGRYIVKGNATWDAFAERSRAARTRSFEQALTEMNTQLHREIAAFRDRARNDPTIRLVLPPGYVLPDAVAR